MLLAVSAILAILAKVNKEWAKSLCFPPVVYSFVWAVALGALFLTGDAYESISSYTLFVYLLGAASFCFGGFILFPLIGPGMKTKSVFPVVTAEVDLNFGAEPLRRKIIDFLIVLLLIGFPFFLYQIQELGSNWSGNFLWSVRMQTLAMGESQDRTLLSPIFNLVPFAIIIALIVFYEYKGTKRDKIRLYTVVPVALLYQMLTGGRAGATLLILALIGIDFLKTQRLNVRFLAMASATFLAFFFFISLQLGKGNVDTEASFRENLPRLVESLEWYAVGSLVAFDRIALEPESVASTGGTFRGFKQIANSFGAEFEIPSLHADYTSISSTKDTNVYTLYAAYIQDFGLVGLVLIMVFLGAFITLIYYSATLGSPTAAIMYGIFFSSIFQGIFNEPFFTNINFILKALLITMLVYWLPNFIRGREAFVMGNSTKPAS